MIPYKIDKFIIYFYKIKKMPAMPRGIMFVLIPMAIIYGIYDMVMWPFRRISNYFTGYVSPREEFRQSLIATGQIRGDE